MKGMHRVMKMAETKRREAEAKEEQRRRQKAKLESQGVRM
jgi:hypothetical protein